MNLGSKLLVSRRSEIQIVGLDLTALSVVTVVLKMSLMSEQKGAMNSLQVLESHNHSYPIVVPPACSPTHSKTNRTFHLLRWHWRKDLSVVRLSCSRFTQGLKKHKRSVCLYCLIERFSKISVL